MKNTPFENITLENTAREIAVSIEGNFTKSINFAMQQNYVPVIRNLILKNNTEEPLLGLDLKISFEPDFAREYTYHVEEIPAGQSVEISPVRLHLRTEYLFSLTEKILGVITVELFSNQEKLCALENEIDLLAIDQWSGLYVMPEIIAAFVTPNHPQVAKILSDASVLLKKWGGNPAFTGYLTQNPNNVKLQMAAIYGALQQQTIIYNVHPASFEIVGQRIRLPHTVLERKQGTCLDLAILYASCLEAAGLSPLLIFIQGHAFGGCWLEEETFADCMMDDISALEKRIVPGAEEILLVECTDFVSGKEVDFDLALKHGKDHLLSPEEFECAVDIRRSRGSGIRPIPLQLAPQEADGVNPQSTGSKSAHAPTALDHSLMGRVVESRDPIPLSKQKLWERKLLDFSLRNPLLNFRASKNAFQLMTADLGELEDSLSDGKDLQILEAPAEWSFTLRDAKMFEIETEKDLISTIAAQEFKSNRIRTFLDEAQLDRHLKGLYRSAKMSMEENGSNTLFLALGFLRWFESDVSEKARYAPLVLMPVDIVRSVRHRGFIIRSRQEEIQINVTLLEYLRQDHGILISGLDPLPEDEHGIDLRLVFHTIRQAVMAKKRWNIQEMAFLGLFSFGQFVMWNDLRNRSTEIEQNKVVSSLISGCVNWDTGDQEITAEHLDESLSLTEMAIPVSADSSQMVAITAAAAGKSFVLHGPPGTGKSQTITNMIANALYQGKSVLFVAEKMAALNVVQKRLADIGLAPFCLELHSNKSGKSSVLAKLNSTLEVGRIKPAEDYLQTADRIHELRTRLNAIVEALHCRRKYGLSLYEAIEIYERNADQKGKILFSETQSGSGFSADFRKVLADLDKEHIEKWEELVRNYKVAIEGLGVYAKHPLVGYEGLSYSMSLRDGLGRELEQLLEKCGQVQAHLEALFQWTPGITDDSRLMTDRLLALGTCVLLPAVTLDRLLSLPNFTDVLEHLRRLVSAGKEYNLVHARLEEQFEPAIFTYGADTASLQWKQTDNTWFLPKLFAQNKLVKELRLYARNPKTITKDRMPDLYSDLCLLQARKREIQEVPGQITELLSGMYLDLSTNWEALEASLDKAASIYERCHDFNAGDRKIVIEAIRRQDAQALTEHIPPLREFITQLDSFLAAYGIELTEAESYLCKGNWLANARQVLTGYQKNLDKLRDKVAFNQADVALRENGLLAVSEAYRSGKIDAENLCDAFAGNLYYELTLFTIAGDKRLAAFHGKQYDDMILQYQETILKYQNLTVQELAARLSARVPAPGSAGASSSELGILKKAIRNNGRMMSLRRLFDQIPTLLRRLCPCMLMSPISVAQYIDPSFPKFDLVIFDEASQLPTSEAVGTIARGENVVIVGDPKQLPPTNFFSANRIDEENSEREDLESLLDDCLAVSMPQESLKWHYRSRHESLIAYSNMKYYDNKLYTFPSPSDLASEVKMVHLEGYYDKGKTKQNKAEARAIVTELIRRLKDEELRRDSLGVVTFSSPQQNLIDDMLFEEFQKYPELEELDRNSREPIFVKNLENVQGDERDVILFSVGYGPDTDGKVSMNFGPLNRDGGWRRLNVAISRARKSMVVYSVLRPEQIDLSRTRAEGVAGLKGFLEFAEKGRNALAQKADSARKEDFLVQDIARAIETLGYEAKCNIGCSQFKMDIGVVNPQNKDTYLLGILLDGENCKQAATARDRFVLQPGVLQGLGWNVIRLWTLDWLDDPARILSQIQKTLEELSSAQESPQRIPNPSESFPSVNAFEKIEEKELFKTAKVPYENAQLSSLGTADEFYLAQTQRKITGAARAILEREAPVSKKLWMRKVLAAWGITRTGSRVENIFAASIAKIEKSATMDEDREFYWKKGQIPGEYECYRVDEENRRSMDDIPSEEILNAVLEVLREQISMTQPDLVRETAKKFGFSRLGNVIENTIGYTLQKGLKDGCLQMLDSGKIVEKL